MNVEVREERFTRQVENAHWMVGYSLYMTSTMLVSTYLIDDGDTIELEITKSPLSYQLVRQSIIRRKIDESTNQSCSWA